MIWPPPRLLARAALTALLCMPALCVFVVARALAYAAVYVANAAGAAARWIERKTLPPELPPIL